MDGYMTEHWLYRDVRLATELDIDPKYVNWISKGIRRDQRYTWNDEWLRELGVLDLSWDTVTDEQIKTLALRLAGKGRVE